MLPLMGVRCCLVVVGAARRLRQDRVSHLALTLLLLVLTLFARNGATGESTAEPDPADEPPPPATFRCCTHTRRLLSWSCSCWGCGLELAVNCVQADPQGAARLQELLLRHAATGGKCGVGVACARCFPATLIMCPSCGAITQNKKSRAVRAPPTVAWKLLALSIPALVAGVTGGVWAQRCWPWRGLTVWAAGDWRWVRLGAAAVASRGWVDVAGAHLCYNNPLLQHLLQLRSHYSVASGRGTSTAIPCRSRPPASLHPLRPVRQRSASSGTPLQQLRAVYPRP